MESELAIYVKVGNHPNILPFIGAITTDDHAFYIISKFCERGSLHDILI